MAAASTSNPPSSTGLPALDAMPRAGSPAAQIALQDSAWRMVETYKAPSGYRGTRLSNAWLGEHDWRVQLFYFYDLAWAPGTVRGLVGAALRRRHSFLLGTAVSPAARPTAVWRLPIEEDAVERFFEAHHTTFSVLFPSDLTFAVHGNDGDFCVFAGPEAFIREALPPAAIGPAATAEVTAEVEKEHGKGCMTGVLAHYACFMIDE